MPALLFRALLVILLMAMPVAAFVQEPQPDNAWRDAPREVDLEWDMTGFTATSTTLAAGRNDTLMVTYDAANMALTVRFTPGDTAGALEMVLRFTALVEIMDHDGDRRYSLGDPVVQRTDLTGARLWSVSASAKEDPITIRMEHRVPDMPNARFAMTLVLRETADADPPTQPVLSFAITNYAFASDNATRLALEARATGASLLSSQQVGTDAPLYRLAWDWDDVAAVGEGGNQTVGVTLQPYATQPGPQTLVVFTYPRSASIQHNTQLIVSSTLPERDFITQVLGDWRAFAAGIVLAAILVVATVRYVMHRQV